MWILYCWMSTHPTCPSCLKCGIHVQCPGASDVFAVVVCVPFLFLTDWCSHVFEWLMKSGQVKSSQFYFFKPTWCIDATMSVLIYGDVDVTVTPCHFLGWLMSPRTDHALLLWQVGTVTSTFKSYCGLQQSHRLDSITIYPPHKYVFPLSAMWLFPLCMLAWFLLSFCFFLIMGLLILSSDILAVHLTIWLCSSIKNASLAV